jgi:non-lysosomal glucosylceramidase
MNMNFFKITQIICLIICLPLSDSCTKSESHDNRKAAGNSSKCSSREWPVLKSYDREHTYRIALPLGGIGTGTVSLGGRGNLQDWEIMNRPAKGYNPSTGKNNSPFFVLYTKTEDKTDIRLLEGPVPFYLYEGSSGAVATNHGLPRFSENSFETAYPFGQVKLKTPQIPVDVKIKAFNPLIPGDVNRSSIPVVILDFELTNNSDKEIKFSICGSMPNFIGEDGTQGKAAGNKNTFKEEQNFKGVLLTSEEVEPDSDQWGEISLISPSEGEVSYRTDWLPIQWGKSLLDFWDDYSKDGILENREDSFSDKPMASLAISNTLAPGSCKTVRFIISWYFPNRTAWADESMTNYYTTQYSGAWDVVKKTMPDIDYLENKTVDFVNAFCNSDLPPEIIEAALFNISTLRTQTCFRLSDGNFYAWEGCNDRSGSCFGSCTHVWNYETATAFLFGDLARSMRKVEGEATNEEGLMSFRVKLPLIKIPEFSKVAADGQMGCIMKLYREWQLSGDDDFLARLYPKSKAALSYAWKKGGWDADQDGVMEGVQHNTMDVEYFGPNPQMTIWYLGALRAMEEMARYMNDDQMARKCRELFNKGSKWTDNNLFNGEYYIHKIILPDIENIPAEQLIGMGAADYANPDYQLGEGCLTDQLAGQYMSHVCGLGYLINKENVSKTLQSIMKYNYRPSLASHFNCMRSYALGDEAALLMASYPKTRPENPFPYFTEVMTGFEYTAAVGMLQEGQIENGLKCIRNIRSRYDGRKRNPFNEAECGHHYGRAMASWSAVLTLTGFQYSAVTGTLSFGNITGTYFWSAGNSYGTAEIFKKGNAGLLTINVLGGTIKASEIIIKDAGKVTFEKSETLTEGYKETFEII